MFSCSVGVGSTWTTDGATNFVENLRSAPVPLFGVVTADPFDEADNVILDRESANS